MRREHIPAFSTDMLGLLTFFGKCCKSYEHTYVTTLSCSSKEPACILGTWCESFTGDLRASRV